MIKIEKFDKPDYNGFQIQRVEHTETRCNRNTGKWGPRTSVYFSAFRDGQYFGSNRTLKVLKRHIDMRIAREAL